MKDNQSDIMNYVNKIFEREQMEAFKNSRGTIILKNGFVFQVDQMFNYFRDTWFHYNRSHLEQNELKRNEMLKIANNGVITNGFISISLSDVAVMIAEGTKAQPFMSDEDEFFEELGDSMDDAFGSN